MGVLLPESRVTSDRDLESGDAGKVVCPFQKCRVSRDAKRRTSVRVRRARRKKIAARKREKETTANCVERKRSHDPSSQVIALSAAKMEELQLTRGDTVVIKGNKGHETCGFVLTDVLTDETCAYSRVR